MVVSAGVGVMMTPKSGMRLERALKIPYWAADNGCYAQGERFVLASYLDWLRAMTPAQSNCLFATAPDVVGDAGATWERSRDVLPILRELGYKAALVAQDGMGRMTVEWDSFDVLFVGGTTAWKLSEAAYGLVGQARRRGKWTHMGRCNSLRRLSAAVIGGYDSADGTHVAFGPDRRLPELIGWLDDLQRQARMVLTA